MLNNIKNKKMKLMVMVAIMGMLMGIGYVSIANVENNNDNKIEHLDGMLEENKNIEKGCIDLNEYVPAD